jgi:hypothetical protein
LVNLKTKSAGDGYPKKALEKTVLRFLGSRTFSHGLGRFETLLCVSARPNCPTWHLSQIAAADLDVPVLSQLAPSQLPLGDALEPGMLEVVRLEAALRGRPLRK